MSHQPSEYKPYRPSESDEAPSSRPPTYPTIPLPSTSIESIPIQTEAHNVGPVDPYAFYASEVQQPPPLQFKKKEREQAPHYEPYHPPVSRPSSRTGDYGESQHYAAYVPPVVGPITPPTAQIPDSGNAEAAHVTNPVPSEQPPPRPAKEPIISSEGQQEMIQSPHAISITDTEAWGRQGKVVVDDAYPSKSNEIGTTDTRPPSYTTDLPVQAMHETNPPLNSYVQYPPENGNVTSSPPAHSPPLYTDTAYGSEYPPEKGSGGLPSPQTATSSQQPAYENTDDPAAFKSEKPKVSFTEPMTSTSEELPGYEAGPSSYYGYPPEKAPASNSDPSHAPSQQLPEYEKPSSYYGSPPEKAPQNAVYDEIPPPKPPRPVVHVPDELYDEPNASEYRPPLPPRRPMSSQGPQDPSATMYTRDPHRLVAYLIPFPKPYIHMPAGVSVPERFLIYTPPPPPLTLPSEGEREERFHKLQRKWQEEVRAAKISNSKTASWKGVKDKATIGISKAIDATKNSNIEFLTRLPEHHRNHSRSRSPNPKVDTYVNDGVQEDDMTHKTVGLQEIVLVHPASMQGTEAQIRLEFINSMLRTKSKAQRDGIIATGLIPVAAAIDLLATVVWPFGGLLEIDSVWAYTSFRGAKTARSVTRRLTSSSESGDHEKDTLKLTFTPSRRLGVLESYLADICHKRDGKLFLSAGVPPTDGQVLDAIGWKAMRSGETRNWENEQWEWMEVKEDLRSVMGKGAREWGRWCREFEKDPSKAIKKLGVGEGKRG